MILTRRAALATALAAPSLALAQGDDSLAKVRAAGVLKVGNGGAFPPFEFMQAGTLTGFDIELGEELGRRMGLRIEWQVIAFAGLIAALTSGRVDTLITAMTWTADRAERIAFSTPYYKTGIAAGYRPGLAIDRPEDLAGRIVGVQVGTSGERYVRDNHAAAVKEIKVYNEFPLALQDLVVGRVECVVNTQPVLRWNIARNSRVRLGVSPIWDARDVGINTRKADAGLMAEINRHLAAMQADGFLASLDAKWFAQAG
ncbi:ABC transporter substrate-binding protein [Falsiroseomonas selenitidurans]|uniref:Amino acid ABC transporter substrate-binding protein n=1 Tax=Falsiroseomonas selenitidurans TaxID=2716335 RepID=A0ABX1E4T3_9PROT|nr:ABC transporter substrate-binding protein [Falsiroseomonas selenitidurans]NKC30517.1 amino acid ABC transporter substrate-binding protein [Falsiroseomonas selenitidurans]